MATIFTKIQRKVNQGLFGYDNHCLNALADENFDVSDAFQIVLHPANCFAYEHDESHTRYAFDGYAKDGRMPACHSLFESRQS